ncbi:MAG: hypothetical protein LBB36_02945 [Fibromonadaceae bacterium]|jgi:hypothetical protein|nr:hypothetical protein [Fibromonadaceae bacterium]
MSKRLSLLIVLLLLCSEFALAQGIAREDDRNARKKWEEDQRADEYANSLRRRDWLKDRLILELGMGSKFPVMGANWFGFGAGVEYITRWHASAFLTGGFILPQDDPDFRGDFELEGGMGWRIGFAYYLFPKSPIHLGVQVSYGTVFYDHEIKPENYEDGDKVRPIIICRGYELDLVVSYLSDQWYFLQAIVGVYTIGNGAKGGGNSLGRTNNSWKRNEDYDKDVDPPSKEWESRVIVNNNKKEAIPPIGAVFGIGIGFAFEEFFPDDTEIRRREREDRRSGSVKPKQFRNPNSR